MNGGICVKLSVRVRVCEGKRVFVCAAQLRIHSYLFSLISISMHSGRERIIFTQFSLLNVISLPPHVAQSECFPQEVCGGQNRCSRDSIKKSRDYVKSREEVSVLAAKSRRFQWRNAFPIVKVLFPGQICAKYKMHQRQYFVCRSDPR